jgi:hypothetical protein
MSLIQKYSNTDILCQLVFYAFLHLGNFCWFFRLFLKKLQGFQW